MINKKEIKISMFNPKTPKTSVVDSNGDFILDNICIECIVTEGLDGTYELDAIFIVDDTDNLYKNIVEEAILKVKLDYGDEIFRIAKITKTRRDITVFARQITVSETLDMWLEDVRPTNVNGLGALKHMKDNSVGKKDIDLVSDIVKNSTAYYQRMCMHEAIHSADQSFINRWGGEVQRRGYTLAINQVVGADRGVQIRSRKNLTGFEANTDIDNVVTRIRPVGYNGITTTSYVDSPLQNKYSAIKTKEIKYEDVKVKDENNSEEGFDTLKKAQDELIKRAKKEFTDNHIDELRAEYRINFAYLEQTEEYKNFVQAERVYIGDIVSVYEEKHDINIHVRAIKRTFDVLKGRVIELELSNYDVTQNKVTTGDVLAELNSIISKTESNNIQDIVQSMINSGIKDSYVIPRQNEIVIADSKDLNSAVNICRINKNGIGFSKTGYYGKYTYGFTIDGVMNASLIATGILSAITIQNADGSLQIDLSSKSGIVTKSRGKKAIELSGTILKFYDWDGKGLEVGNIYTEHLTDTSIAGISLGHLKDRFSAITYKKDSSTYSHYITFDKYNVIKRDHPPIAVFEDVGMGNNIIYLDDKKQTALYNSVSDNAVIRTSKGYHVISNDKVNIFYVNENGFSFYKKGDNILYTTTNNYIYSKLNFQVGKNAHIEGNFSVKGAKNCVQSTKNYGERLFYAVEDAESYLTYTSPHTLNTNKTESGEYERVVLIDNIYKECVNLEIDYIVEVHKMGWGDYRIKEQTKDYFIVESNVDNFEFKYTVKAKRRGFESEYMNENNDFSYSQDAYNDDIDNQPEKESDRNEH